MQNKENNYAFIDGQNLNLGIQAMGWKLDWSKFRVYLKDKYKVQTAFVFLGYMPEQQNLYRSLQMKGYVLVFKPVITGGDGVVKGNVDADLVLQAMIEYNNYDKAILVSSDGDFQCLVRYFNENDKLKIVMSSYIKTCSKLLKKAAKEKIMFMDNLRKKLEYIQK